MENMCTLLKWTYGNISLFLFLYNLLFKRHISYFLAFHSYFFFIFLSENPIWTCFEHFWQCAIMIKIKPKQNQIKYNPIWTCFEHFLNPKIAKFLDSKMMLLRVVHTWFHLITGRQTRSRRRKTSIGSLHST